MHPVEHVIYFSTVLIYWVVPSHPIHALFTLLFVALMPAPGHAGFDQLVVTGKAKVPSNFFHYLHHRYFECNYGDPIIPYDRWFGTFHHGTPEAHARMQERWADERA